MSATVSMTAEDAVALTRELIPELRDRAAQTASDRSIPQANIDSLRRMFGRLLLGLEPNTPVI